MLMYGLFIRCSECDSTKRGGYNRHSYCRPHLRHPARGRDSRGAGRSSLFQKEEAQKISSR